MKPSDSRSVTPSQTQEDYVADELLEGAHADPEKDISPKEEVAFNLEELKNVIADLETNIADGSWIRANYSSTDIRMMPVLVQQANKKYPEMNLQLANNPEELALFIKKAIDDGIQASRIIIHLKDRGTHFAVIDHKTIGSQNSLIFFESTTFNGMQQAGLAIRTQMAIQSHELPNCHFSMAEMNIQRSISECGIFSLALAKKLYTESGRLEKMHKDNIEGTLCTPDTPLPYDKLDLYLPATFYKHTQGTERLKQYVKSNPDAANEKINKKGETLFERLDRNSVTTGDGKTVSVSSHKKRIREYRSTIAF
ncbi:YopJ/AvrA family T3SS effector serine/threonine acetyltransferase [Bartonella sp. CB178]|uniref:YopJ/AvrA family T3SS effector serine/threonine acetyltransferase n=1 Tax=Bartonella sp. CB178 TaxID=3112255 RepID=UPI003FA5EFBE